MNKLTKYILTISLIIGGLIVSHSTKANILPFDYPVYYSAVYIYVDNQPVDDTFVIRQRHGFPVYKGMNEEPTRIEYERKLTSCQEGYCYLFPTSRGVNEWEVYLEQFPESFTEKEPDAEEHVKKGQYNSRKDNKLAEYDITTTIQELDTQALTNNDFEYEIRINSSDGTISVDTVDPILTDYEKEYNEQLKKANWEILKTAWPLLIYGVVALLIVIGLPVITIIIYRRIRKRKKK